MDTETAKASKKLLEDTKALDERLKQDRQGLWRQIAEIDMKRERLALALEALQGKHDNNPDVQEPRLHAPQVEERLGMTPRIRAILRANEGIHLYPAQVRDLLLETGFKAEGRSNLMAEIHQVLKRIKQASRGKVTSRDTEVGTAYKFEYGPGRRPDVPTEDDGYAG
ncbi:MAG: hypothetical protein ABSH49_22010 [Bryobacteraceae bacterium]|jgi:hypothetical protein